MFSSLFTRSLCILLMTAVNLHALELQPVPDPSGPSVGRLPWVAAGTPAQELTPLWQHQGNVITCSLSAAQSPDGIELAVSVLDPTPDNSYSGKQLWRGDCVYVNFDGRGDGNAAPVGVDDGTVIVGLGSAGPEGRVMRHGCAELLAPDPRLIRHLERDSAGCTRYRLLLPWDLLGSAPGLAARMGLSVNVAHKDENKKDTLWGSVESPMVLELPMPIKSDVAVAPGLPMVLDTTIAQVAASAAVPSILEASVGTARQELTLAPGAWRRVQVIVRADELTPGANTVTLRLRQGTAVVWEQRQSYRSLTVLEQALIDRIALLRRNREPATASLVGWYLDSLEACLGKARSQRPFTGNETEWPALYGQVLELLLAKLPRERVDLAEHSRRGTPLVGTFVSRADDTLQFYALQLPFGFTPTNTYPITIYLHGSGSPYAIGGLATAYDNRNQDTLFREVDINPAQVPPLHRGFVLAPWARGNGMYIGVAGQDVLQSLQEVESRFHVDPDRRYLTGFSMGCHGAARLAMYYPDLWAGVNLASGFGSWSDASRHNLRENLRQLPLAIWCGEEDSSMYAEAQTAAKEFKQAGFRVSTRFVPKLPHTYPYDEYNRMVAELSPFRRDRFPTNFTFRTDVNDIPGRNGIDMRTQLPANGGTAGFSCLIEGNTITINSDGCDGLSINCDRLGLNRAEVVIRWNGREAYRGKPDRIFLPEPFTLWSAPDFNLR